MAQVCVVFTANLKRKDETFCEQSVMSLSNLKNTTTPIHLALSMILCYILSFYFRQQGRRYYSKNEIILLSRVHFKSKDLGGMVERITFLMLLLWEKKKKKKKEMVEGKKDREREINVARSIFLFCDEKVSDLQEEEKKNNA